MKCPHCGYCKECGRSDQVPYYPYPYPVYPYYPYAKPYCMETVLNNGGAVNPPMWVDNTATSWQPSLTSMTVSS